MFSPKLRPLMFWPPPPPMGPPRRLLKPPLKAKLLNFTIFNVLHNLPIVLFLLRNVDPQRLWIIVQYDASIEADCLFELRDRFKFDIAESFELISFLVLHQTNILHRQFAEDLNNVSLHNPLRQITDESQKWWLCWQWLFALMIVEP